MGSDLDVGESRLVRNTFAGRMVLNQRSRCGGGSMARRGPSISQTTIIAICALMGAIILGILFFLSDLEGFIRDTGR